MKRWLFMNPCKTCIDFLVVCRLHLFFTSSFSLLMSFTLFSCGVNNQIKGHMGGGNRGSANDFARSEIIVNGTGIADGQTPLYVLVRLVNTNGTVVPNYRPDYQIMSGTGVTGLPCTASDSNGVAVCALKASAPGLKSMRLTNLGHSLQIQSNLEFLSAANKSSVVGLSSSGGAQQLASGYLAHASMSDWNSSIYEMASGYKVYVSLQGGMDGSN